MAWDQPLEPFDKLLDHLSSLPTKEEQTETNELLQYVLLELRDINKGIAQLVQGEQ
jgi:hypothetical protein